MSIALMETPAADVSATVLDACTELVDAASHKARRAFEDLGRRWSEPAERAAYALEEDALALEVALMHLQEVPAEFWTRYGHLAPVALLASVLDDLQAETCEEEARGDR